jgi:putative ABC transport system permease protein
MFGNYLIVALRNIVRHKLFAVINIGGLALGLACVILISLYIRDELAFDQWVPDSGNLYRLDETFTLPGRPPIRGAVSDFPLPALLKDNLPEVAAMAHFWPRDKTVVVGGRAFSQQIAEADSDFFQVIRFPLLRGDPATALSRPDAVVISQALARKLYGNENAVGRTMAVNIDACGPDTISCTNQAVSLRITGIMRDLPGNTQLRAEAIVPHTSVADSIGEQGKQMYYAINGYNYVRLAPGADPVAVAAKIPALLDTHVNVLEDLGMKLQASKTIAVRLVRFRDVHFDTDADIGGMVPPVSRATLYGLGLIGLLILLVACFNFTNLATARAMGRAREIALRKCAGARRSQIMMQFLGESVLTALLALVGALSLAEIVMPAFARFLGQPIVLHYVSDWPLLLLILAVAVTAGLVGGFYPALVLSRFRPAPVLRANNPGHTGSSMLRSVLVVLQFGVAIGLGVMTLVVFAQLDFVRHQSLGFRRDNILIVPTYRAMNASARQSFVEDLRRHPGILQVSQSSDVPLSGSALVAQMRLPGHGEYLTMERELVTPEFFRLYDMRLLAGRYLSDTRGEDRLKTPVPLLDNDGRNIMINRAAAALFGFQVQDAVGKIVLFGPSHVRIVGVVADARVDGARDAARPTVYLQYPDASPFLSVQIAGGHVPEVLDFVDRAWRRFSPNVAIQRHFMSESFDKLYLADEKQGQMLGAFVIVAIAIACLGLFGLAAFTARQRTREIGIRRVFGARTDDLSRMLLWQFSLPVLLANLIAWPLAWYYLHGWLQGFADRIALNPLYFLGVGLAALLIAWITVFTHALRVARANPIRALRYE